MADTRIAQRDVRKAAFTKSSVMPEGLLDALPPEQVSDLFAYLKTLTWMAFWRHAGSER